MQCEAAETTMLDQVPDIDALFRPTRDERARQQFVSVLRNHAKSTMRDAMQRFYERKLRPDYEARHGAPPASGEVVEGLMESNLYYRVYSSVRYNAQRMMFLSAIDPVQRAIRPMVDFARRIGGRRPAGGTLRLNPDLALPRYVTELDVHLIPGGFHTEYVADDVAQGAIIAFGGRVSTGANVFRKKDPGGVGRSIGYWLSQRFPDFSPRRMLDLGTQSGKNLRPYIDLYPQVEAHGVDVSAPTLRYGHVKSECLGKRIHFSQQNAESMDFPDGMFDLIVSSFFFHELPLAATRRILAECKRLLAPGGIMLHMELPPRADCDAWQNFYWDWDAKHNNEPFYTAFRSQDPMALLAEAGFSPAACMVTTVPDVTTCNMDRYDDYLAGGLETPLHGRGGWFIFGARNDG